MKMSANTFFNQATEAWTKGDLLNAIISYKKVLALDPEHQSSFLHLGKIYASQNRWHEAKEILQEGLKLFPNNSFFHKNYIRALIRSEGWSYACQMYRLCRLDQYVIKLSKSDIICCLVIRNERPRLPWFLEYYRKLGIKHFFVIDNYSTDDTISFLRKEKNVYLWQTDMSFNASNFGSSWFEIILQKYGIDRWCLTLDADEIITFEGAEHLGFRSFCQSLEMQSMSAASGIMLDMVSDKPISETVYKEGEDFLRHCPYFDKTFYHEMYEKCSPLKNQDFYFGGLRKRVFNGGDKYIVTKTPLIKYKKDTIIAGGQHWTNAPTDTIAHQSICVMHFKYFSSFINYVKIESTREEHSEDAVQYKLYQKKLDEESGLNLYDPNESVAFINTRQLVDLGIIKSVIKASKLEFPAIRSLNKRGPNRPFWSIVITVYNRLQNLERAIQSVLAQVTDDMQILIVNDGMDNAFQEELKKRVFNLAKDRIEVVCLKQNLGHPYIFNKCIELADGHWVHILHDDDILKLGFYKKLRVLINQHSCIGAAFVRTILTDDNGEHIWTTLLEKEEPGVLRNWLDRISLECRIQFSSIVVARATYEKIGGFVDQVGSTFDWEMWIRIAAHNLNVGYIPEILCDTRRDGRSMSDLEILSGQQVSDNLKTIEFAYRYLPERKRDFLFKKANDKLVHYGLLLAKKKLLNDERAAVIKNLLAVIELANENFNEQILKEIRSELDIQETVTRESINKNKLAANQSNLMIKICAGIKKKLTC